MEAGCERHLCVMKYDSFESVEKVLKSILALPHKTASAEETNRLVNTISVRKRALVSCLYLYRL